MACKKRIDEVTYLLTNWEKVDDNIEAITRNFKFTDFKSAFSFITMIALKAEEINHHPEWENVYNSVKIKLTTHDLKGLSDKDIELGQFIDSCYTKMKN